MVFDNAGKIMISHFNGDPLELTHPEGATDSQPAISPGQDKIVFVSDRDGSQDLFIINRDGSHLINLTNTPDIDESMPDWGY